jgi:hypothetical protein
MELTSNKVTNQTRIKKSDEFVKPETDATVLKIFSAKNLAFTYFMTTSTGY